MRKIMYLSIALISGLLIPQSGFAVTKKAFDFVVGVNGNFKAAMSAASSASSSGKRFYIFFPNGEYNIGTLTGDTNQMTTITTSNISFVGECKDNTVILNQAKNENISTTATLYFKNANNLYLQDLTVLNKGNYGDPSASSSTGRYVAVQDQGDRNIYKNVKLLSNQDTYYTLSTRTYWEDGEIHGFVDFICGYGDVFFNRCLLYLENRSSVVIAAPSTKTSWGYVFMNCTIDGAAGNGYRLGRPWSNTPKCVYINTIMKKTPSSEGWGDPMNVVPTLFAEYNSKTASGTSIDLGGRRTTYSLDGKTVKLNPVLSASQVATYTIANVLNGSDNWQPDEYTKQASAPVVFLEGSTLKWDNNSSVLCWVIFQDKKFYKCVTSNSCDITPNPVTKYSVRAANEMGGLGPVSNTVDGATATQYNLTTSDVKERNAVTYNSAKKALNIQVSSSKKLNITIFNLDGKVKLSRKLDLSGITNVEIPLGCLKNGTYLIRSECDGSVKTLQLNVL